MCLILGSLLLATACSNSETKDEPSPTDDTDAVDTDLVDTDVQASDTTDTGDVDSLGGAPRAWTLRDATLHRNGRWAVTLSEADTLTFRDVDFGTGADANGADIWFDGVPHDFVGVVSGTCTLGAGCD